MAGVEANFAFPVIEALIVAQHGEPRALTGDELLILDAGGESMVTFIRDRWPVDTGSSQDAWMAHTSSSPGTIGIQITNDLDYAEWVHPTGTAAGDWYWQSLVTQAWTTVKPGLIADLSGQIIATEQAIRAAGGGRRATLRAQAGTLRVQRISAGVA